MSRRGRDLIIFGLLGVVTFIGLVWTQWHWPWIAARLMGRRSFIYDQQLPWVRSLHTVVGATPWLISCGLFVFAVWKRRWIPVLAFGAAQILGICSILFFIFGVPVVKDYATRVSFDQAVWKAENTHAAKGMRIHMVDDLLRKHPLVGMSKAQVDDLLGVPPPTDYFRDYDYVYWLGPERGAFSIDSEWLVLKLANGSVVRAELVTD
jgi:hypothetical protein